MAASPPSSRTLTLLVLGLAVILAVAVVFGLLSVRTPTLTPAPLPSVSAA